MCHMVADSLGELHGMTQELGLRRWFQDQGRYPHYDISKSKKKLALTLGAIEVTEQQIIQVLKEQEKEKI